MAPVALLFFSLRHSVDKYNLLYRCRLKDSDGLLDRAFLRTLISLLFLVLVVSQIGLFLYLVSKSAELGKCAIAVTVTLFTPAIYAYLYIFVWGRGGGGKGGRWEEDGKKGGDECAIENESYHHPLELLFHSPAPSSSVNSSL